MSSMPSLPVLRCLFLFTAIYATQVPAAAFADEKWNGVKSWVYQLTDYQDGKLDEIAASRFDLAVVDLARDGGDDYFTKAEIEALKKTGKIVLAYFEIGAIEDYRPEWDTVPQDLKAGEVEGWPKEQYVKFWDERWWPVVKGRVDRALSTGFDGAYLDLVTAYEEIPSKESEREALAHKMVDLIARISQYAKARNPDFKIVPQNCPELYTWSFWNSKPNQRYLTAVDGLGLESVFYLAHDKPAEASWCEENRANALALRKAGKLVLGIDYAKQAKNITAAYARQRALGFVPYASVRDLNVISNPPPGK
jgi:cysteinyl-tRNA synthetase